MHVYSTVAGAFANSGEPVSLAATGSPLIVLPTASFCLKKPNPTPCFFQHLRHKAFVDLDHHIEAGILPAANAYESSIERHLYDPVHGSPAHIFIAVLQVFPYMS